MSFLHNLSFTDIDVWPPNTEKNPARGTGLGARIAIPGAPLAPYRGNLLQIRIEDRIARHTVALYRVPQIGEGDFEALMPDVLDAGTEYDVKIYIDANGNKSYDNPARGGPDLGFVRTLRSPETFSGDAGAAPLFGIDDVFDLATTAYLANQDVGEP